MEAELGKVGDLKVVKKSDVGYILENGTIIVDTFAETCTLIETAHSVLSKPPFFCCFDLRRVFPSLYRSRPTIRR